MKKPKPLINTKAISRLTELPLLFAIFLDMVGFGMVLPDIQTRLDSFGAKGWLIGGVLASYFLIQMAVSPLWGRLSDHIGRKPVLLLCGWLSAGSMAVYAFAHGINGILLSRVLAGFAAANVVVAQAYIADVTPVENRTEAMGRIGVATTAGLIFGPVIGGWLATLGGNTLLGFVAASASGLGALWIGLVVPSVAPVAQESQSHDKQKGNVFLLRDIPTLRSLFLLATLAFLALACLEGTFGRLIRQRFGYGPAEFGLIFSYEAIMGVATQTLALARLSKRLSPIALLRLAYVLQGVGLSLMPFAPNLACLFVTSTFYAVGVALSTPTLNSLCSAVTPLELQGEMFGLLQSSRSTGFLFGPIIGGALFDWNPASPYLLAGGVVIAVGCFLKGLKVLRDVAPKTE